MTVSQSIPSWSRHAKYKSTVDPDRSFSNPIASLDTPARQRHTTDQLVPRQPPSLLGICLFRKEDRMNKTPPRILDPYEIIYHKTTATHSSTRHFTEEEPTRPWRRGDTAISRRARPRRERGPPIKQISLSPICHPCPNLQMLIWTGWSTVYRITDQSLHLIDLDAKHQDHVGMCGGGNTFHQLRNTSRRIPRLL